MTERLGVAIVGGGPAGAVLATRLATVGQPVVVLERSARVALAGRRRVRVPGRGRGPPADRLGCGAAAGGRPADPGDAGRDAGGVDLSPDLRSGCRGRPAVGFDRSRLDPLAARAGRRGRRRHPAGMVGHGGRSRDGGLTVRRPDGSPPTLAAALIVGADGPHSVVAKAAAWLARHDSIRGSG